MPTERGHSKRANPIRQPYKSDGRAKAMIDALIKSGYVEPNFEEISRHGK